MKSEPVKSEQSHLRVIDVILRDNPYQVVVGPGALEVVGEAIPKSARQVAVVTQEAIGVEVDSGMEQHVLYVPEGEKAKSFSVVEVLCRQMARLRLTRSDVVIGVGGGVVTDVAGFAASIFHRGLGLINVPTSLLGQVDAAIGGKTGVNLPEGKNLAGSFWQPIKVICDTEVLSTLPEHEMRSGRGEMAKYAFIGAQGLEELDLVEQIAVCAQLKASVVAADEREVEGARAVLNYGHTLAHALEAAAMPINQAPTHDGVLSAGKPGIPDGKSKPDKVESVGIRHGEAVAIGLIFAANLAHLLGRIDEERVNYHYKVVRSYGLGERLPEGSDPSKLFMYMQGDKKAMFSSSPGLTFVLDGPAGVELVTGIEQDVVETVLKAMA